ncbi:hypothetical protein AN640_08205 [Candidatus Epulonipiscium fishelsonii]|uniref:Uncharacterized protein n=1 Tax=Candidatus Epulonipiscium fishelsonii TaxID=77094 RepID=A0ACC8XEF7_9FIRM|nr:hypothetical protein AN640_08205 [Epulopiscium sp. SCG-D08WGA-EpuloA1]OON94927.1 MAG: hypothetical protein ATN32_07725 [Epulopiscium sp. AS2M-Bin002]
MSKLYVTKENAFRGYYIIIASGTTNTRFMTQNPIPTMPKSNPHFNEEGQYWRGGVWALTNYMF